MSTKKHPFEENPVPEHERTLTVSDVEIGSAVQIPIQAPSVEGKFFPAHFLVKDDWVVVLTSHGQLIFPESILVRIEGEDEQDSAVYQTDEQNSVWISSIKWSKPPRTIRIKMNRPEDGSREKVADPGATQ